MKIALSDRLRCVADFVLPGSRIADVGTDHGYLPAWLLQNGVIAGAVACDVNEGPLRRAVETAEAAGVSDRITFRLCNGLRVIDPADCDTVVMAGMGGELIGEILKGAPWVRQKRLILQPQSKHHSLLDALKDLHLSVTDASLACDAGKYYQIWLVVAGAEPVSFAAGDKCVPRLLMTRREQHLPGYLDVLIASEEKRLTGLSRAATASKADDSVLRQLREMKEETRTW